MVLTRNADYSIRRSSENEDRDNASSSGREAENSECEERMCSEDRTDQPEPSNRGAEEDSENEDQQPEEPARFYHKPEDYSKSCKFMRRCDISKVLENLEKYLSDMEMEWFKDSQFKHVFHMPREKNRKLMGMWMLILRTACLNKRKEWWFVVNGVPVRYSIREHALISGLDCREYPEDRDNIGSFDFVQRHFNRKEKIFLAEVEDKVMTMPACEDRLHMGVLYFLSSVIKMKAKVPSPIEPFILRVVDDLDVCQSFPWGRFTFEHWSAEINHLLKHLKGEVREKLSLTFPAFIFPLELLTFETVSCLRIKYREDVKSRRDCPRMCQRRFKDVGMKGFPISDLNQTLGETKDICSILEPTADEKRLLARIWDEDFPQDYPDEVAEAMTAHLNAGKKIFWENLYKRDVSSRVVEEVVEEEQVGEQPENPPPPPPDMFKELKDLMDVGFSHNCLMMELIDEKISMINERVKVLEADVQILQKNDKGKEKVVNDDSTFFDDAAKNYGYMGEGTSAARHEEERGGDAPPSPV